MKNEIKSKVTVSLEIRNANLIYQDKVVFEDLNFTLGGGQWTCLLGASGVGKSSLLRFIAGSLSIYKDTHVSGKLFATDKQPLSGRISYMGQKDLLLPWLSVADNIVLGFKLRAELKPCHRQQARELLKRVGLTDTANLYPSALSGGMRQRVALCRTLIENRPVILMDEPFSALDAVTRIQLQDIAAELLRNKTVLLVTHDPLEALRLGHRIYVMVGQPATFNMELTPDKEPIRNINDEHVLNLQAQLLEKLADG